MSNQITGRLASIGQPQEIPSKNGGNPLVKREFLLDATTYDPYTGVRSHYENVLPLEVVGDKCAELDQFHVGDVITVSFALQGREWTNQDGQVKRMVSIRCYKLEARRTVHQPAPAQPMPGYVQQPIYPQQQSFPTRSDNVSTSADPVPF